MKFNLDEHDEHPFKEGFSVGQEILGFLGENEVHPAIAIVALASAFTALVEMASNDEVRCYALAHNFYATYSTQQVFEISSEDMEKQIKEIEQEYVMFNRAALKIVTDGMRPN